jgi:hypothetical protein
VGAVKNCSRTLRESPLQGAPFRSGGDVLQPTKTRSQSISGQELGPTHASLRSTTAITIASSDSSLPRSGMPNQFLGVLLHTIGISGLSRVRTELFQLLVIPFLTPHPVQSNRQPSGHRNLGGLPPSPHHQVGILAVRTVTCAASTPPRMVGLRSR